jgi:hypothetical protein
MCLAACRLPPCKFHVHLPLSACRLTTFNFQLAACLRLPLSEPEPVRYNTSRKERTQSVMNSEKSDSKSRLYFRQIPAAPCRTMSTQSGHRNARGPAGGSCLGSPDLLVVWKPMDAAERCARHALSSGSRWGLDFRDEYREDFRRF